MKLQSQQARARFMMKAVLLSAAMLATASAQISLPAQFAATAIGQAGPAAGKTVDITIFLNGLASEQEAQEYLATLKNQGQAGLVSAFEKAKEIGRVAIIGTTGTAFVFARVHPDSSGGARIVMATNRPLSFGELYNMTRSTDYPIAIVTLNLDKNGKGTGELYPACKVKVKNNELDVEQYGIKPFRLANVRPQK